MRERRGTEGGGAPPPDDADGNGDDDDNRHRDEYTPDIIVISAIYFVEGALGLARLAQTMKATKKIGEWKSRITLSVMESMIY